MTTIDIATAPRRRRYRGPAIIDFFYASVQLSEEAEWWLAILGGAIITFVAIMISSLIAIKRKHWPKGPP